MPDVKRINGNLVSSASCIFKFNGSRVFGFVEISWGSKRTRELGYGSARSGEPLGFTSGKYEPGKVKVKFFQHTWRRIRKEMAQRASDGVSYGSSVNQATLQIVEPGETPELTEFVDLTFDEHTVSANNANAEAVQPEITFLVRKIVEDGTTAFQRDDDA